MSNENETPTMVTISMVSAEGDTLMEMLPPEAAATVKDLVKNKGKWLFDDEGNFMNADELTAEDLIPGREYFLSNLLNGGEGAEPDYDEEPVPERTPYRTKFSLSNLDEEDYDMCIDIDADQKKIEIVASNELSNILVRNRVVIGDILEETLQNIAIREVKAIQDRLGVGCPMRVVENYHGMHSVVTIRPDILHDIEISLETADNTLYVNVLEDSKFIVVNRRTFINHLLREKLESAGAFVYNAMRKAVNL